MTFCKGLMRLVGSFLPSPNLVDCCRNLGQLLLLEARFLLQREDLGLQPLSFGTGRIASAFRRWIIQR